MSGVRSAPSTASRVFLQSRSLTVERAGDCSRSLCGRPQVRDSATKTIISERGICGRARSHIRVRNVTSQNACRLRKRFLPQSEYNAPIYLSFLEPAEHVIDGF